ncbi:MAG: hypothetical protein AB7R67_23815 [Vicinamibacterales bacterium]
MLTPTAEQRAELDAWYETTSMASGRQYDPDKYRPYCAGRWALYSKLPLDLVNRVYDGDGLIENWSDLAWQLEAAARTDAEVRAALDAAKALA